jgi:hypothetical protein
LGGAELVKRVGVVGSGDYWRAGVLVKFLGIECIKLRLYIQNIHY